jgi:signal transduction histidine kinase
MGCTGLGLRDALSTIKNDIAKGAAQLEIELVISTGLEHIPDDVARTLLRCVQTLLQNILRHSGARTCTVQLLVRSTDIVLSVEDDGVGFDLLRVRKGLGMRELLARTEVVGGKVHIDSAPGCGSFIEIVIPRKDVEA